MHICTQAEIESEEEQEARTPLSEVREDDELWGEVTKVSNYGAFVDVGVKVQGFLHIIYYPKRGPVRCLFWPWPALLGSGCTLVPDMGLTVVRTPAPAPTPTPTPAPAHTRAR